MPTPTPIKDALDHARTAAQELHGALSDAAAQRGAVVKIDLAALPLKARAIADSLGQSLDAQHAATRQTIGDAVTFLHATATHIGQSLNVTGQAAERSVERAVDDARAAVQKISEAVAAKRSAASSSPFQA